VLCDDSFVAKASQVFLRLGLGWKMLSAGILSEHENRPALNAWGLIGQMWFWACSGF